jgi:hypothetical protein
VRPRKPVKPAGSPKYRALQPVSIADDDIFMADADGKNERALFTLRLEYSPRYSGWTMDCLHIRRNGLADHRCIPTERASNG